MHVPAEELVVALEAVDEALGRQDPRLPLVGVDLHRQTRSRAENQASCSAACSVHFLQCLQEVSTGHACAYQDKQLCQAGQQALLVRRIEEGFCISQHPVPEGLTEIQGLQDGVRVAGVAKVL